MKERIASLIQEILNVDPSYRPAAKDLLVKFQSVFGDESDSRLNRETPETVEDSSELSKKNSQLTWIVSRFDGQGSLSLQKPESCLGIGSSSTVYLVFAIFLI